MTATSNNRTLVEGATGELFGKLFPKYDDRGFLASVDLFKMRYEANGFDTRWFQGKECLDAGCGGGRYTIAMALLGAAKAIGIDLGEPSIIDARRRARELNLTQTQFETGSILDIPFPDDAFDFVCCSGVLMILVDSERGMAELSRVLKPGGILYLLVYATEGLRWPLIQLLRPVAKEIGFEVMDKAVCLAGLPVNKRRTYLDDLYCPILDFYTWERMQSILRRFGFDRIERWQKGRLDHEENLKAYREDLEGLLALWDAGAHVDDPEIKAHRERFLAGSQAVQACVSIVRQAEADVESGNRTEVEAMQNIIGQGHHRLLAWKATQ